MEIRDQLQRSIHLEETPKRIVSLVPSQTELLVDLGLEDRIVGLTKFCVHPAYLRKEKTIVGGTKQVNFGEIKALNPDIILCNKEENTREIVERLASDYVLHLSDIADLEDTYELIEQYGDIFDVVEEAKKLISDIKSEKHDFEEYIRRQPVKKVAYFIWRKPWMVAGGGTFIDYLLGLNNMKNVYGDQDRYPVVDLKELKETDWILLSSEPFPFQLKHKQELENELGKIPIKFIDGEFFSWYGSRLLKAFRYFKKWREAES